MREKRVAELERKGRIGKEIEILIERKVDLEPSHNISEVSKLTKITIAPDGEITHEALIDKTKENKTSQPSTRLENSSWDDKEISMKSTTFRSNPFAVSACMDLGSILSIILPAVSIIFR